MDEKTVLEKLQQENTALQEKVSILQEKLSPFDPMTYVNMIAAVGALRELFPTGPKTLFDLALRAAVQIRMQSNAITRLVEVMQEVVLPVWAYDVPNNDPDKEKAEKALAAAVEALHADWTKAPASEPEALARMQTNADMVRNVLDTATIPPVEGGAEQNAARVSHLFEKLLEGQKDLSRLRESEQQLAERVAALSRTRHKDRIEKLNPFKTRLQEAGVRKGTFGIMIERVIHERDAMWALAEALLQEMEQDDPQRAIATKGAAEFVLAKIAARLRESLSLAVRGTQEQERQARWLCGLPMHSVIRRVDNGWTVQLPSGVGRLRTNQEYTKPTIWGALHTAQTLSGVVFSEDVSSPARLAYLLQSLPNGVWFSREKDGWEVSLPVGDSNEAGSVQAVTLLKALEKAKWMADGDCDVPAWGQPTWVEVAFPTIPLEQAG